MGNTPLVPVPFPSFDVAFSPAGTAPSQGGLQSHRKRLYG